MAHVSGFETLRSGPLASLQDAGRFGVRHLGITQGGAVDLHAWAWANWLVANPWGAPALEITFGGLQLKAMEDLYLAISGADLGAEIDGEPPPPWSAFMMRSGQVLEFKAPRSGLRAYLAVFGGFQAEPVLGSCSGVVREGLGGHDGQGRQLAVGDRLQVRREAIENTPCNRAVPEIEKLDYTGLAELEFVLGAQAGEFSGVSLFEFFNRQWEVDSRSDRMGIRLQGPALKCAISNMVSEGLALGAVQVPPDGQPIVLMNDRQTIGGYPRLGTLPPLACSRLAQCQPGSEVSFRPVSLERAHRDYIEFVRRFQ
ncbi:biotin-dependent carboxyltransferase [Marinobacter salinexigens]|uniref:Biotin-dependent carboxyltransferase n=1 Tax=Marinobacter salinexigens TaxID=2919747 RepID=A0A5B0VK69_9GAMM|nr:biotin-dependent carboxyltransferase family protein [Marinobacter salinexigens]KAA1174854.1 biotin-dependent carboxyltransferase [Marinobacter salinexigens]